MKVLKIDNCSSCHHAQSKHINAVSRYCNHPEYVNDKSKKLDRYPFIPDCCPLEDYTEDKKIPDSACICFADQYGYARNIECIIHGDKK